MDCRRRDAFLVAYFDAQAAQAKAVTAVMNEQNPEKRRTALLGSATARMDVLNRKADLEAHCLEHGCQLHKI
jgi:hypothetical protein